MTEQLRGIICFATMYEYRGWLFEYRPHVGVWPLRKDGEPRKRAGRKFWSVFTEWMNLSEEEQQTFRVGGGRVRF